MKKEKFVIISNDAMVYDDLEYLSHKFAFKRLMGEGSVVKTLRSIYPTVTYAVHTSMITGCYPIKREFTITKTMSCALKAATGNGSVRQTNVKLFSTPQRKRGLLRQTCSGRLRVRTKASITMSPNIGRRQRKKRYSTHLKGQARLSA